MEPEEVSPEEIEVTPQLPDKCPISGELPEDILPEEVDLPPRNLHLVCPYRGVSSKSTIVDESEEFPEPIAPLERLQALEDDATANAQRRSFAQLYHSECLKYGVTPLKFVQTMLEGIDQSPDQLIEVDLNRFGCSNLQMQIILDCLAVACPDRLVALDASHNLLMNVDLANSLANLLQASQRIERLDLSHSTLSDEVMKIVAEAIATSSVRQLNLSHCEMSDAGGMDLFTGLGVSDCVESVDVSWNRLEHTSGQAAGAFLAQSSTVQDLNLEGNRLYLEKECNVPLLKELAKNESLKRLNLAWNALRGPLFGPALVKALTNSGLEALNLEMNCLRSDEAQCLLKAFRKCEHLREIRLGGNFFTEEDVKELVKAFGRNPSVKVLALGKYQFISKIAARLSKRFMTRDPSKSITFQGVLMANPPRPVDVPEMLLDRCRFLGFKPKRKKKKRDLGHLMLQLQKLEDPRVPREDFVRLVKKFRIKLDKSLMETLMEAFPAERRMVDCAAMAGKYLGKYPTEPPSVKAKKGKGKKKKKKAKL